MKELAKMNEAELCMWLSMVVSMSIMGAKFWFRVEKDLEFRTEDGDGRKFIQVEYEAPCTHTGQLSTWRGRKWYLSKHMTNDEVIKTAFVAFEAAVKHEVLEGFKVKGKALFNPHVSFEALLEVSDREVKRALTSS